jgi:mannose-6-phosphate isomerase-like protein (cupin superfamily)
VEVEEEIKIEEVIRPWGMFRRFTKNIPSTVKILTVKPNERLSLQSHTRRAEFWHVVKGSGSFELDGQIIPAGEGSEQYIPIGSKHRISSGENGLEFLEISLGDFDEEDEVKYEDKYGRI